MFTDMPFDGLMTRLQRGEPTAANAVFHAYASRLMDLARSRLSPALAAKVDPEDVMQSVLRSFFVGHCEGQFTIHNWDALWAILVVITLRKCRRLWRHFKTKGRDVGAEVPPANDDSDLPSWEATDREPLPEEVAMLTELIDRLLRRLDPERRPILELRLQGCTVEEIAAQLQISERTVHRILAGVREHLRTDLL